MCGRAIAGYLQQASTASHDRGRAYRKIRRRSADRRFPVFKNNERIPSLRKERRSYIEVMSKTVKKIWNWITTVLVAVVVILALLLVGARLIGLQVFTVLSGSMEPTYHVGSLIYVKDVDPYELESGDVITFMLDEDTVATHRIVEVVPDENDSTVVRFKTKGDANDAEDGSHVHYKNVIGSPVFTIPKMGYSQLYPEPARYIHCDFCRCYFASAGIPA